MPYNNPETQKKYNTETIARLRAEAFPRLAAMMGQRCRRCGFTDIRALRLRPLVGALKPSRSSRVVADFHRRILREAVKNESHLACYDLLCANCDLTT